MRGIKIGRGRYKKTRGGKKKEIKREEKAQVSPHTKDKKITRRIVSKTEEERKLKQRNSVSLLFQKFLQCLNIMVSLTIEHTV